MLKELVKLANHLDNIGHADLADQLDSVVKMAQDAVTTPAPADASPEEAVGKAKYPFISAQVQKLTTLINEDPKLKDDLAVKGAMTELTSMLKTTGFKKQQVYIGLQKILAEARRIKGSVKFKEVFDTLNDLSLAVTRQDLSGTVVQDSVAPAQIAATVSAPDDGSSLKHPPETKLQDDWGTYVVDSPTQVTATKKGGNSVVLTQDGYKNWRPFVIALNKLTPVQTPAPVAATVQPTTPVTPAASTAAPAATVSATPGATPTVAPAEKARIDSLERLSAMIKPQSMYPRGYFSNVNFPDIDQADMNTIGNPNGKILGSEVKTRINKIIKQRYGKLKPSGVATASDSEEKINKIAEALEDLSFDFSKLTGSVRR